MHKLLSSTLCFGLATSLALPSPAFAARTITVTQDPSMPDPNTLTDEQKMETAKRLYGEAEALFAEGKYPEAMVKYEAAYFQYAPSLHLFNFNIGQAAFEAGDCAKAKTAYQRFLDLVPDNPHRANAQERLIEIERTGCAQAAPAPAPTPAAAEPAPVAGPRASDYEDGPDLSSRRSEREEAAEREREKMDAESRGPKFVAGVTLISIGAAAAIGGAVTLGIAAGMKNELESDMAPGPTGYPTGDYSDEQTYQKEAVTLPALNVTSGVLLGVGGAALVTGAVLVALDAKRRKAAKGAGGDEESPGDDAPTARTKRRRAKLIGVAPAIFRGGGGAAAAVRF